MVSTMASKAQNILGWELGLTLEEMIEGMVEADLARHRARMSLQTEMLLSNQI